MGKYSTAFRRSAGADYKEKVLDLFQVVELDSWCCLLGHIFMIVEVDNATAGMEQW